MTDTDKSQRRIEALCMWLDASGGAIDTCLVGLRVTNRQEPVTLPPISGKLIAVRHMFGRTDGCFRGADGSESWWSIDRFDLPKGMLDEPDAD